MFIRRIFTLKEIAYVRHPNLVQINSHFKTNVNILKNGFHQSRKSGISGRSTFRQEKPPVETPVEVMAMQSLVKPFIFTIAFSSASIAGAAIWQYETLRSHARALMRRPVSWFNAQQTKLFKPGADGPISRWWAGLREHERVFIPILALNALVFAAWKVTRMQPFMLKYFCSNPASNAMCWPMVLSTFSHYSGMHILANMYVLYSFMPAGVAVLGKEQFIAMYMSGGVVSSFVSYLYKVTTRQPGLSLGASGAIMAVLSYVCVEFPDTRLSIVFLPMFTFAAGQAIGVIVGLDVVGVILGWRFFDHAAHLGGAFLGIAWCLWGSDHIWNNRDKFLQYWHKIRESTTTR